MSFGSQDPNYLNLQIAVMAQWLRKKNKKKEQGFLTVKIPFLSSTIYKIYDATHVGGGALWVYYLFFWEEIEEVG